MKENDLSLKNCGFIKTILMLLVILGHACAFWEGTWFTCNPAIQSKALGYISSWVGSFHIYAFALVSGYLFAFKVYGRGYTNYLHFMNKKAKRLLIPYAFAMLVWVAPISAYYFKWTWAELINRYVLCTSPSQLWFLWMLFGVFVIVWPLRNIMMQKPLAGWALAIIFYGFSIIGGRFIPNVFCVLTACQYIVFFYIGMRIMVKTERHEPLFTQRIPWYCWIIVDLMLFAVERTLAGHNGYIWKLAILGIQFLLHIVGAVMAWTALQTLAAHIHWQNSKAFKTLAAYTMPMYLFHQQIIYFIISALNGVVNPLINASINFAVAVIGSFLISTLLMKWKATRFLIGEKA